MSDPNADPVSVAIAKAVQETDERWVAAMKLGDFSGGVLHYDGRSYPLPTVGKCGVETAISAVLDAHMASLNQRIADLEKLNREFYYEICESNAELDKRKASPCNTGLHNRLRLALNEMLAKP